MSGDGPITAELETEIPEIGVEPIPAENADPTEPIATGIDYELINETDPTEYLNNLLNTATERLSDLDIDFDGELTSEELEVIQDTIEPHLVMIEGALGEFFPETPELNTDGPINYFAAGEGPLPEGIRTKILELAKYPGSPLENIIGSDSKNQQRITAERATSERYGRLISIAQQQEHLHAAQQRLNDYQQDIDRRVTAGQDQADVIIQNADDLREKTDSLVDDDKIDEDIADRTHAHIDFIENEVIETRREIESVGELLNLAAERETDAIVNQGIPIDAQEALFDLMETASGVVSTQFTRDQLEEMDIPDDVLNSIILPPEGSPDADARRFAVGQDANGYYIVVPGTDERFEFEPTDSQQADIDEKLNKNPPAQLVDDLPPGALDDYHTKYHRWLEFCFGDDNALGPERSIIISRVGERYGLEARFGQLERDLEELEQNLNVLRDRLQALEDCDPDDPELKDAQEQLENYLAEQERIRLQIDEVAVGIALNIEASDYFANDKNSQMLSDFRAAKSDESAEMDIRGFVERYDSDSMPRIIRGFFVNLIADQDIIDNASRFEGVADEIENAFASLGNSGDDPDNDSNVQDINQDGIFSVHDLYITASRRNSEIEDPEQRFSPNRYVEYNGHPVYINNETGQLYQIPLVDAYGEIIDTPQFDDEGNIIGEPAKDANGDIQRISIPNDPEIYAAIYNDAFGDLTANPPIMPRLFANHSHRIGKDPGNNSRDGFQAALDIDAMRETIDQERASKEAEIEEARARQLETLGILEEAAQTGQAPGSAVSEEPAPEPETAAESCSDETPNLGDDFRESCETPEEGLSSTFEQASAPFVTALQNPLGFFRSLVPQDNPRPETQIARAPGASSSGGSMNG